MLHWCVLLALQASCCSSEASLTTPGCVSWRTPPTPLCPGQGSSSSIRGEGLTLLLVCLQRHLHAHQNDNIKVQMGMILPKYLNKPESIELHCGCCSFFTRKIVNRIQNMISVVLLYSIQIFFRPSFIQSKINWATFLSVLNFLLSYIIILRKH